MRFAGAASLRPRRGSLFRFSSGGQLNEPVERMDEALADSSRGLFLASTEGTVEIISGEEGMRANGAIIRRRTGQPQLGFGPFLPIEGIDLSHPTRLDPIQPDVIETG